MENYCICNLWHFSSRQNFKNRFAEQIKTKHDYHFSYKRQHFTTELRYSISEIAYKGRHSENSVEECKIKASKRSQKPASEAHCCWSGTTCLRPAN